MHAKGAWQNKPSLGRGARLAGGDGLFDGSTGPVPWPALCVLCLARHTASWPARKCKPAVRMLKGKKRRGKKCEAKGGRGEPAPVHPHDSRLSSSQAGKRDAEAGEVETRNASSSKGSVCLHLISHASSSIERPPGRGWERARASESAEVGRRAKCSLPERHGAVQRSAAVRWMRPRFVCMQCLALRGIQSACAFVLYCM